MCKLCTVGLNMCLSCTVNEYDIFSVEYWCDLEIGHMSRSRSLKMAPIDESYSTYYWSVSVTIALFCTIFESFDVQ